MVALGPEHGWVGIPPTHLRLREVDQKRGPAKLRLLGAPGRCVGAPRRSVGALGRSWALLAALERSLGAPGRSGRSRRSWALLGFLGRSWALRALRGRSWALRSAPAPLARRTLTHRAFSLGYSNSCFGKEKIKRDDQLDCVLANMHREKISEDHTV